MAESTILIESYAWADSTSGTNIREVKLYRNNVLVVTDTSEPYTYLWKKPAVGNYSLQAIAIDNNGLIDTSNVVTISVVSQLPTITITNPSNGASFKTTDSIIVKTSIAAIDSFSYVKFTVDSTTDTLVDYSKPYTALLPKLLPGSHIVNALGLTRAGSWYMANPVSFTVK